MSWAEGHKTGNDEMSGIKGSFITRRLKVEFLNGVFSAEIPQAYKSSVLS